MSKILFATNNPHKLREAQEILDDVELTSLVDLPSLSQIEARETGSTFAANAEIKARAYGQVGQLLTLADDSGLEVEALHNEPGVYSNRWLAGTDRDRYQAILERLSGVTDRRARFKAVACLHDPSTDQTHFFKGVIEGTIADEARGENGFGYDPIFIPEGHRQTFGELSPVIKHQLSHRGRALASFRDWWQQHAQ